MPQPVAHAVSHADAIGPIEGGDLHAHGARWHHANMHINLKARAVAAAERARRLGITQQRIASELGVSQSQVSRVFSAAARRRSRVYERVCKYVEGAGCGTPAPARSQALMEALHAVWDGTETHAQLIARVIQSLAGLSEYRSVPNAGATRTPRK